MTVLTQITLNESAELEFGIEVSGADDSNIIARFIIEAAGYSIICPCVESAGIITAKVPKLAGVLNSGTYIASLEIIVGDRHFKPLTENIQFTLPVSVEVASTIRVNTSNQPRVHTTGIKVLPPKLQVKETTVSTPARRTEIRASSFLDYVKESVASNSENPAEVIRLEGLIKQVKDYKSKIAKLNG